MAGCDFLDSPCGLGIRTAYQQIKKFRSYARVGAVLGSNPTEGLDKVEKAALVAAVAILVAVGGELCGYWSIWGCCGYGLGNSQSYCCTLIHVLNWVMTGVSMQLCGTVASDFVR